MNPTFQWCVWNVNVDTPIYVKTKFSIKKLSNSNNCKKKTVRHTFLKINLTLPGDKKPRRTITRKTAQMIMLLCLASKLQSRKKMFSLDYNLITCFVLALDSTDRLLYV